MLPGLSLEMNSYSILMNFHKWTTTITLMGIWPLAELNSAWMGFGDLSVKTFGQKLMRQLLVTRWAIQDMVCSNVYCQFGLSQKFLLGALVGNQKFTDSEAVALIHQNLNCAGTENRLSECIGPLETPDASLVSGCRDVLRSAYVVCQGK